MDDAAPPGEALPDEELPDEELPDEVMPDDLGAEEWEALELLPEPTQQELDQRAHELRLSHRLARFERRVEREDALLRWAWQSNWYVPRERGRRDQPRDELEAARWESAHRRPSRGGQRIEDRDGAVGGADAGPSPRISLRLPVWMHERLMDEAERQGRTPSALVRECLTAVYGDGW